MIVNYCAEGIAVSDFEDIEKMILKNCNIVTSSQSIVEMARILFLEGKIDSLQVQFNGVNISIKENGMFEYWPEGFCDLSEKLAQRLLKIMAQKYEEQTYLQSNQSKI